MIYEEDEYIYFFFLSLDKEGDVDLGGNVGLAVGDLGGDGVRAFLNRAEALGGDFPPGRGEAGFFSGDDFLSFSTPNSTKRSSSVLTSTHRLPVSYMTDPVGVCFSLRFTERP